MFTHVASTQSRRHFAHRLHGLLRGRRAPRLDPDQRQPRRGCGLDLDDGLGALHPGGNSLVNMAIFALCGARALNSSRRFGLSVPKSVVTVVTSGPAAPV
jgi:hypothetical protein